MTIGSFLIVVVLVSLVSAFLLLLATKVGIVEYLQTHGDSCISKMAQCYFCMSFWTGLICFLALTVYYDYPLLVFGAVFSAPLTRHLLAL